IETLPRTSRSRRALIWREVTYFPSRPASGEVSTPNVIRRVGASTSRRGRGRGSPGSVIVSPIVTSGSPATDTISPAEASEMSTRSMPWAVWRLGTAPPRGTGPPRLTGPRGWGGVAPAHDDPLADPDRAVADAAHGHATDVVVGGEVGDEQLGGGTRHAPGGGGRAGAGGGGG